MCGKHPCDCVMPEGYFNYTFCSANESQYKCKQEKKDNFLSLCLCLCLCQGCFYGEIKLLSVSALVRELLAKTRLKSLSNLPHLLKKLININTWNQLNSQCKLLNFLLKNFTEGVTVLKAQVIILLGFAAD